MASVGPVTWRDSPWSDDVEIETVLGELSVRVPHLGSREVGEDGVNNLYTRVWWFPSLLHTRPFLVTLSRGVLLKIGECKIYTNFYLDWSGMSKSPIVHRRFGVRDTFGKVDIAVALMFDYVILAEGGYVFRFECFI